MITTTTIHPNKNKNSDTSNTMNTNSTTNSNNTKCNIMITSPIIYDQPVIQNNNSNHPLPSILTDFIAFKLCDLIKLKPIPIGTKRKVPELLYFILKITCQAKVSCHTAIVALIYLERCKKALPKNAIGDQDTIHRIFIASILVASKFLNGTCWGANNHELNEFSLIDNENTNCWLTNGRMAEICNRFYTLNEINQLELSFLSLIKFNCFVTPIEVQQYVLTHRQDLLL